jgi:hypothetical protein
MYQASGFGHSLCDLDILKMSQRHFACTHKLSSPGVEAQKCHTRTGAGNSNRDSNEPKMISIRLNICGRQEGCGYEPEVDKLQPLPCVRHEPSPGVVPCLELCIGHVGIVMQPRCRDRLVWRNLPRRGLQDNGYGWRAPVLNVPAVISRSRAVSAIGLPVSITVAGLGLELRTELAAPSCRRTHPLDSRCPVQGQQHTSVWVGVDRWSRVAGQA